MTFVRGLRPDYMVGTITLVSGSVNFTTVGTSLLSSSISQGDTIMTASGRVLIIDEITNDNAGKLFYPCPADAAGVNRPLHIRFQPSGSGSQGAQRDLAARWSKTGIIDALAQLSPGENMLAYLAGLDGAKLTPLTPYARTLLDDADAAAALSTLGFSAFMRGQANSNSFAGWGITNSNNPLPDDNLDTLRTNGVYRASSSVTGAPNSSINQILHMGQGSNYAIQIAFPLTLSSLYFHQYRTLVNNVWTDWRPFVAQRGSNANGEFVRFMDGTQICWGIVSVNYNSGGSLITNWSYPAAFVGARETRSLQASLPVQYASYVGINPITPVNLTTRAANAGSGAISVYGTGFVAGNHINDIHVEATGRWF